MVMVEKLVLTEFETNCYIIWQEGRFDCLIIDPGGEVEKIRHFLNKNQLKPEAVLLTHGHIDHIGGCGEFRIKFYINEFDFDFLKHPEFNLSIFFNQPLIVDQEVRIFRDGDILNFPKTGLNFKVIHTPGHTPGSSCFLLSEILFSGDTLFKEGLGRTDFPRSSWESLQSSVLKKLFLLPDETRVYPGHGPQTTIGYEKRFNPFLG